MKMIKRKTRSRPIAMLLIAVVWAGFTLAQESVNASGGNLTGSGGSTSFSLGQVAYSAYSNAAGSAAEGVQHAYEIYVVGVNELTEDMSLRVFPNPTSDNLSLEIENYNKEKYLYQLYDMQGKLLVSNQIVSNQTLIQTNNLQSSTYFLHILNQQNQPIQLFKIIKN